MRQVLHQKEKRCIPPIDRNIGPYQVRSILEYDDAKTPRLQGPPGGTSVPIGNSKGREVPRAMLSVAQCPSECCSSEITAWTG